MRSVIFNTFFSGFVLLTYVTQAQALSNTSLSGGVYTQSAAAQGPVSSPQTPTPPDPCERCLHYSSLVAIWCSEYDYNEQLCKTYEDLAERWCIACDQACNQK